MANDGPNLFEHFTWSNRMWILDHLTGISSRALLALRSINNKARGNASVVMTREEIGKFWFASVATVQRAIEELEAAGLLICERSRDNGTCQGASSYRLVWSNLKAIANGENLEEEAADEADFQIDTAPAQIEPAPAQFDTTSTHRAPALAQNEPTPSAICATPPAQFDTTHYIPLNKTNNLLLLDREEGEVLKSFKNCGVKFPGKAVEKARLLGASAAELLAIAEFYQQQPPGKWGPGAICLKLENWAPGDPPDAHWPDPDPKWIEEQKRQQRAAQAAQRSQQRKDARTDGESARECLESRYGPILDALSDQEVKQIFDASPTGHFMVSQWRKHGTESRSVRSWLLHELKRKEDHDKTR